MQKPLNPTYHAMKTNMNYSAKTSTKIKGEDEDAANTLASRESVVLWEDRRRQFSTAPYRL